MSLGSWDPQAEQSTTDFHIDSEVLHFFIGLSEHNQLDQLSTQLSAEQQQLQAKLMQLTKDDWFNVISPFSDEQLEHLICFFTLAEKLPGWEAGEKSPVIWLGKMLKQRGTGINRDLVLWIKANSSNQYLPHGPLL